ncbi:MAG: phenylalanine--tRNA ligase subunit alpha [Streptococcaceae bacterium]|jgi:phenylalanyl-tRNA synthetase alpha chain|nr:phenylalanine--tRNA ligase subunit alpha [Streptococcaceae bacterium]
MTLQTELEELRQHARASLLKATDERVLNELRVSVVGKKGALTAILKNMKELTVDEKKEIGQLANQFRDEFARKVEEKKAALEAAAMNAALASETLDVTLPGTARKIGTRHVLTQTQEELEDIFIGMGYTVVEGNEVETDYYNFERVNLPKNHPARDMQDSFYITDELLLRTHTSGMQARTMETHDFTKGDLRMISPGAVYRRDTDDATHSHQFHQLEGMVIGAHVSMADLKGTLEVVIQKMFGADRKIRLRPSYFPFTEPSVEVDVSCFKCGGAGCNVCKQTGWIEILGAGMTHPNVIDASGVDSRRYQGFAFGIGLERIAMLKYGITDIRGFYQGDVRFLEQFGK